MTGVASGARTLPVHFCGDQAALSLVFYMFLLLSFFFVLSVLLLFTVSSYPFGIFKFF